jgi:hypothetical protein
VRHGRAGSRWRTVPRRSAHIVAPHGIRGKLAIGCQTLPACEPLAEACLGYP